MLMTIYMNVNLFTYKYCQFYFHHWNCTCIAWFYKKIKNEHVFKEFLEYVANEHGSWFFMKGAPQAPFMKHVVKVGQCEVYDLHEPNPMTWIEGVLQYLYIDTATIKSRLVVSFPNKLNIHLPKIDCQRRVVTTLEEISKEFNINLTPTNVTLS